MENTIENQIRFMGLYLGTITVRHKLWETRKTEQLNSLRLQECYYLELKPLSSITDEDAIEVANNLEKSAFNVKSDGNLIQLDYYWGDEIQSAEVHIIYDRFASDYLRSKGYALPYLDLSVEQQIEYNWIKLKTE